MTQQNPEAMAAEEYMIEFTPVGISYLSPIDKQTVPNAIKRGFLAGISWQKSHAQPVAAESAEIARLKEILEEFNDDDNWMLEGDYIDRPSKTGRSDMIYIGIWDPRVLAANAIAGTAEYFTRTKPEQRKKLNSAWKSDERLTEAYHREKTLQAEAAKLREALYKIENGSCVPRSVVNIEPADWQAMYQSLQSYAAKVLAAIEKEKPNA